MKKFIYKLLKVGFFLYVTLSILDIGLTHFFLKKDFRNYTRVGEAEVWNDIYNSMINVDVAIYGSSRSWRHISPKIIKEKTGLSSYNFGIDGHGFNLQYLRHRKYFNENSRPKTVLLTVGPNTLNISKDLYNYNLSQLLPFMFLDSEIYSNTFPNDFYFRYEYLFPLIRYGGRVQWRDFILGQPPRVRKKGYAGTDIKWLDKEGQIKCNNKKITDSSFSKKSIALLDKFIKELKKENIKIIIIYTPFYIEGQDCIEGYSRLNNFYSRISKRYDVPFYDYSKDSISSVKDYFYNAMHLNKKGAEIFTKKLINDLKKDKNL